ncbi:hypothetical protein V6N12_057272 [Hibiscus sabdariffa]|uniref:Uncharacterized protein n=1 Tax=Hibiscus sabdariffa TaxID=183260 RepID=A0ABR2DBC7_9ROSI
MGGELVEGLKGSSSVDESSIRKSSSQPEPDFKPSVRESRLPNHSQLLDSYSMLLIERKDEEGQSHVLSAALEIAEQENLEVDSRF